MKAASLGVLISTGILLAGCSTSIRSVEGERQQLATLTGNSPTALIFVGNADFAPVGELGEGYSADTKGVVAITNDTFIWRPEQSNDATSQTVQQIPLADIAGFSWDGGLVQMKYDGAVYLLRLSDWHGFQASDQRTDEFLEVLYDQNLPIYVATESYAGLTQVGSRSSVIHDFRTNYGR